MSLSQIVGKRLREDGIHLDYRPDDKVGGPGPRRRINPCGIAVKEYRGDFDVAYVDRCGPDVDWSRIKSWITGYGWTIDTGEDDEILICRGRTSRISSTTNPNRVCPQCNLANPHNPGSNVCVDCE